MYQDFYHLHSLPFENTPDARFFFASEQHREALSAIEYTIRMRKGLVLITGDIGSGKTTVGCMMCETCGNRTHIVQLVPRHCTGIELMQQLLRTLHITTNPHEGYAGMLDRLAVYLNTQMERRKPVVLFIDEAQSLSDDALEELRLLSNLDTARQKLIQIVLIGQPELRQRISEHRYDALRQRIVMAKQLQPLAPEETAGYIRHRVKAASRDPRNIQAQFSDEALNEIHRLTGGVPRLINVACDNCMLLGFVREARCITPEMVHQVIEDMVPRFNDSQANEQAAQQQTLTLAGNL